MRILHLIGGLDPAQGGPPGAVVRMAAAQGHAGQKVQIASLDPGERMDVVEKAVARVPYRDSVELVFLKRGRLHGGAVHAGDTKRLFALIRDAQVVHCHGVWEPLLYTAAGECRRRGVPYVIRPAGMLEPWSMSQKRAKKWLAMALGYRRMLDHAAFLQVLNDEEGSLTGKLGLRSPMEVIPNGVFFEEVEPLPRPGAFYAEHPELNGRRFVLFLSRLHHKKGLDYLADAFALFARRRDEYQLVVVGPEEGAGDAFRQKVAEHGLTERVHMVGPLYGSDRYKALVDAACFCLPSRQEGFSNAVLEALAAGCPVVISHPCHFNAVEKAGAGRVVSLDAQAIADALEAVCGDAAHRQRQGESGRALVSGGYTWHKVAAMTVAAYQRYGVRP